MSGPGAVIKVGGSLFGWGPLPARLAAYLDGRRGDRLVLVAGGGGAADFVRALDAAHALGEDRSHALALRAMDLAADALVALLPETLRSAEAAADLATIWDAGRVPVFAPRLMLDEDDARGDPDRLDHAWSVTADAIAARVAVRLGVDELVLLKSSPAPEGADRFELARLGLVDPAFNVASRILTTVRYLDFRRESGPGRRI